MFFVFVDEEDDKRLLLRCEPPTRSPAQPMDEEVSVQVIYDLLNTLIKPPVVYAETASSGNSPDKNNSSSQKCSHRRTSETNRSTPSDTIMSDPVDELPMLHCSSKSHKDTAPAKNTLPDDEAKKPLLPKHLILKLLAESVRSYGAVAKLITEFSYKAGQSELITEVR